MIKIEIQEDITMKEYKGGRPYYGYSVGVLMLDMEAPLIPGNVGNAMSYDFPVLYKVLEGLPAVQRAILDNVSAYVRPGGVLLYCTCTLLPRENGEVVDAFLDAHPDFQPEAFSLPAPIGPVEGGRLTLWPHIHGTDGFYIAKLRRCL